MTFKHEYVVQQDNPNRELSHKRHADKCEYEIGQLIGRILGWTKVEQPSHLMPDGERMKLEIEAFPMDKWIEFRVELIKYLSNCIAINEPPQALTVLELIKDLESFGKPAGEAKELNK